MHSIGQFFLRQGGEEYSLSPESCTPSSSTVTKTFVALAVGIGTVAAYLAWLKFKDRKVTRIEPSSEIKAGDKAALPVLQRSLEGTGQGVNEKGAEKAAVSTGAAANFMERKDGKQRDPFEGGPLSYANTTFDSLYGLTMISLDSFTLFYLHQGKNSAGKTLSELQEMGLFEKEYDHRYIQWLFPTDRASNFNDEAPVFSPEQFKSLSEISTIQENVKISFLKMLEFYGLQLTKEGVVQKSAKFDERAKEWLTCHNHNFLRISRILRSLVLFGLTKEAQAFYQFLRTLKGHHALTDENFQYWKDNVRAL